MENAKEEKVMKRLKKRYIFALIFAVVGTIFGILTVYAMSKKMYGRLGDIIGAVWLISIAATYICGGLPRMLRMVVNIAKWGWFLIPVFPVDICVFLFVAVVALATFLILPIMPMLKIAIENRL